MPKNLQNVREDILGVTRAMIAESGYADLNIRNIAVKCGIGTGTFYNYFSSKQEVVAAIVMHEWELTLRKMDKGVKMQADCPDWGRPRSARRARRG
jgi:AcrR family transcriptional regulator